MRLVTHRVSLQNSRARKKLDAFLKNERISAGALWSSESSRAYPSQGEGHHEDKMGGEYDQEVPRRVLGDGSKKPYNLEARPLRLFR